MGFIVFIVLILLSPVFSLANDGMVSGRVVDGQTGEPLPLCNIILTPGNGGEVTDSLGMFVIPLEFGEYKLNFSYTGYRNISRIIILTEDQPRVQLTVELTPVVFRGEEVIVLGQAEVTAPDVQIIEQVDLRQMPNLYSDVLRSIKVLPGVTSNNELSSAYNVRGGNYDENLIYLNGYQIYRPYLLRTGVEENQSLLNPDMTRALNFYSGGFPVRFGDRMSSVLNATYGVPQADDIKGVARADLLNVGLAVHQSRENWGWSFAARYANPVSFLNRLQTSGDYRPQYSDIQLLLEYQLSHSDRIELLFLYADNTFDLTPRLWKGNFKMGQYDVRGVDIEYSGYQRYTFQTGLTGLKWEKNLSPRSTMLFSMSGFISRENEDRNLMGDIYYVPDAREPWSAREYLKTRFEEVTNRLDLSSYDLKWEFIRHWNNHRLQTGISLKKNNLQGRLDEKFEEQGNNILTPLEINFQETDLTFNQFEWYGEEQYVPAEGLELTMGLRYLYYDYSAENLISPRLSIHFFPGETQLFYFRWGFYYQPPYYYEITARGRNPNQKNSAQRAIHYNIGWEHQLRPTLDLQVEIYYKKLDRLISYYIDDLQLIYQGTNANEGYAQGLDILIKGEIIEGLNSWIGYSYLNTKERSMNGGDYRRRLLDQTHTLRFFVQDKIPKFPFLQFHTRILYGSGYRYYPRRVVENPVTNESSIQIDFSRTVNYPYYGRVDMGLSARLNTGKQPEILITAELMNAFNNFNVLGYDWVQVFSDVNGIVPVPRILTRRFLNLGIEVGF